MASWLEHMSTLSPWPRTCPLQWLTYALSSNNRHGTTENWSRLLESYVDHMWHRENSKETGSKLDSGFVTSSHGSFKYPWLKSFAIALFRQVTLWDEITIFFKSLQSVKVKFFWFKNFINFYSPWVFVAYIKVRICIHQCPNHEVT